jgi:hypothetical protein
MFYAYLKTDCWFKAIRFYFFKETLVALFLEVMSNLTSVLRTTAPLLQNFVRYSLQMNKKPVFYNERQRSTESNNFQLFPLSLSL